MSETCSFCAEHDPVMDEPIGPTCGQPATQRILWKDGRISLACGEHGLKALDSHGRQLVKRVTKVWR